MLIGVLDNFSHNLLFFATIYNLTVFFCLTFNYHLLFNWSWSSSGFPMHFLIRTTKVLMSTSVFYFLKVGSLKMLLLYSYFSQKILTSTVIRQKCESQKKCFKKTKHTKFSEKRTLPLTYVCVSGDKKCSFFGKFGVLCSLETAVLRFAFFQYYRRLVNGKNHSLCY